MNKVYLAIAQVKPPKPNAVVRKHLKKNKKDREQIYTHVAVSAFNLMNTEEERRNHEHKKH